jgi:hypothetical protein
VIEINQEEWKGQNAVFNSRPSYTKTALSAIGAQRIVEKPMPQDKNQSTALVETRPPLKVTVANPRGFCAGVDRAIQIVELALEKYGAPVYVRHEIVHNRYVVEAL